jgi:hypothetical protein
MLTAAPDGPPLTAAAPGARPACRQRRFSHWADDIYYEGAWDVGPLYDTLTGHLSLAGDHSSCTFAFEGCGVILQFWVQPGGGLADIAVDGAHRVVDLASESSGLKNVQFDGLAPGMHLVRITGKPRPAPGRGGDCIVFHQAVVYERLVENGPRGAGPSAQTPKAVRFHAIYQAPGPLGWAERTVLYGTSLGARPRNVLVVGKGQAGAALIVVGALDDAGAGALTCLDPDLDIAPEHWQMAGHRTRVVIGAGAEGLAAALVRSGAAFDFAFVDYAEPALLPDWGALVGALRDGAPMLIHAAPPAFAGLPEALNDGGVLVPPADGTGGLRLLRRRAGR